MVDNSINKSKKEKSYGQNVTVFLLELQKHSIDDFTYVSYKVGICSTSQQSINNCCVALLTGHVEWSDSILSGSTCGIIITVCRDDVQDWL